MSRSGFALLLGWLTEGVGGEAPGAGDGFFGEKGRRGRAAVMRIVNNHLRFDGKHNSRGTIGRVAFNFVVVATSSASKSFEDSTGLLSSLIPQSNGASTPFSNPQAFNSAAGELKLGPAPISEELRAEAEKSLREQAMMDRDPTAQYDNQLIRPTPVAGIVSPTTADLLPHPQTFKTVDVRREVEKVMDARKRIRLDPTTLSAADGSTSQGTAARQLSLPSVCAYTLHDVHEGFASVHFTPLLTGVTDGSRVALHVVRSLWTRHLWPLDLRRAIFEYGI
jgi:transcription initiation factor TFIID subunit 5